MEDDDFAWMDGDDWTEDDEPDADECMCDGFCERGLCDMNPHSYFDHTPGADNTPPWYRG